MADSSSGDLWVPQTKLPKKSSTCTYRYRDAELEILWTTSVPISDESAIDNVSTVNSMLGIPGKVAWVEVRRSADDPFRALTRIDD